MKQIVIAEDELFMREELSDILQKAGYEILEITEFDHVADQILTLSPDLALLDLNLPGTSGFQICRELKQKSAIPVLVLTSRDQMRDELHALELGRVSNVMKRYEGRSNLLEGPGFLLDRQTYTLYIHNRSVVLAKNQGKLLEVFLNHGNEVVSKEKLCLALWETAEFIDENALQVNLTRLKKTMANLGMSGQIVPVRGIGYRLLPEGGTL